MFSIIKIDEIAEIIDEMADRYGKPPEIVDRLVQAAKLRFFASIALFERIIIKKDKASIILPKGEREEFYTQKFAILMQFIQKKYSKDVQFKQSNEVMKLEIINKFKDPGAIMDFLIMFCNEVIRTVIRSDNSIQSIN